MIESTKPPTMVEVSLLIDTRVETVRAELLGVSESYVVGDRVTAANHEVSLVTADMLKILRYTSYRYNDVIYIIAEIVSKKYSDDSMTVTDGVCMYSNVFKGTRKYFYMLPSTSQVTLWDSLKGHIASAYVMNIPGHAKAFTLDRLTKNDVMTDDMYLYLSLTNLAFGLPKRIRKKDIIEGDPNIIGNACFIAVNNRIPDERQVIDAACVLRGVIVTPKISFDIAKMSKPVRRNSLLQRGKKTSVISEPRPAEIKLAGVIGKSGINELLVDMDIEVLEHIEATARLHHDPGGTVYGPLLKDNRIQDSEVLLIYKYSKNILFNDIRTSIYRINEDTWPIYLQLLRERKINLLCTSEDLKADIYFCTLDMKVHGIINVPTQLLDGKVVVYRRLMTQSIDSTLTANLAVRTLYSLGCFMPDVECLEMRLLTCLNIYEEVGKYLATTRTQVPESMDRDRFIDFTYTGDFDVMNERYNKLVKFCGYDQKSTTLNLSSDYIPIMPNITLLRHMANSRRLEVDAPKIFVYKRCISFEYMRILLDDVVFELLLNVIQYHRASILHSWELQLLLTRLSRVGTRNVRYQIIYNMGNYVATSKSAKIFPDPYIYSITNRWINSISAKSEMLNQLKGNFYDAIITLRSMVSYEKKKPVPTVQQVRRFSHIKKL